MLYPSSDIVTFSHLSSAFFADYLEIVERKGVGHPDTLCDGLSEALSQALLKYYLAHCGSCLHYNVDKVLLSGGSAVAGFGGGKILAPITITIAGRATAVFGGRKLDLDDIVQNTTIAYFEALFPNLKAGRDFIVHSQLHPGSEELTDLFAKHKGDVPLANDTSVGVGYAPLSPLERLVLDLDADLQLLHAQRPTFGLDSKIMALRHGNKLNLMVACAMVGAYLPSLRDYDHAKQALQTRLLHLAQPIYAATDVWVNAADHSESGKVYLTVTGTSAEAGDDGETGRGNRANGLITPLRPMTIEAMSGKNCMNHTGKLYTLAAQKIANIVTEKLAEVRSCVCYLVSRIGAPITQPQLLHLCLDAPIDANGRFPQTLLKTIEDLAMEEIKMVPSYWRYFIATEGSHR